MSRPQEAAEPETIRRLLVEQVTGRVRWRESMLALTSLGVDTTVECGGNKVLTGMVKRIDKDLQTITLDTPAEIEAFAKGALMMFDLTGKTALVTGASGGIGGAIAKALHAPGRDGGALRHHAPKRWKSCRPNSARAPTSRLPISPTSPRSKPCPRRRKPPPARPSTSWSTMPASPATISSCA